MSLGERRQRVDGGTTKPHLEVQMRPGRLAGGTDAADALAGHDPLTVTDLDARQVRVQRADAAPVRDRDQEAPASAEPPRVDDAARRSRADRSTRTRGNVD